ncbi:hypothetical protein B0H13DRAFT_2378049 [Mycena leptocephala]|nr:hypothetical protein B0H13DRAFT_2378049 [Mycena leptocephala]
MAPHDLTPAEIAQLLAPVNHPSPLSADELEQLVAPSGSTQGYARCSAHHSRLPPPEYDDEIDTIIRNLDLVEIPIRRLLHRLPPYPRQGAGHPKAHTTPRPTHPVTLIEISDSPPSLPGLPYPRQGGATLSTPTTPTSPLPYGLDCGLDIGSWCYSSTPSIEPNPLNASSKSNMWYVVCRGVVPGVYRSFLECSLNTSGVKGNMCGRFTTLKDAESCFDEALKSGWKGRLEIQFRIIRRNYSILSHTPPLTLSANETLPPLGPSLPFVHHAQKSQATRDEVLDRRAQAAWNYRQRNQEAINAKAKLRMRQRRETLLTAPSAVQLEHSIRAAQYRRNYLERTKKPVKPLAKVPSKKSQPTTVTRVAPAANQQNQKQSAVTPSRASKPVAKPAPKPKLPRQGILPTPSVHPRPRIPGSPSPRSLGDIADGDDDAESEMDSDDDGWDADSERDGLGPLLNHTGHPDYVPQPGQQPYFKAGRRYWF